MTLLCAETMHWHRPILRGPRPTPRENPCTALVGTRLFVVGGYADSALNDLYVLDTASNTWGQPPITGRCLYFHHVLNDVVTCLVQEYHHRHEAATVLLQ